MSLISQAMDQEYQKKSDWTPEKILTLMFNEFDKSRKEYHAQEAQTNPPMFNEFDKSRKEYHAQEAQTNPPPIPWTTTPPLQYVP